MFERFTADARHAISAAQNEAWLLNHNYIGTEHVLLGLFANADCMAASALTDVGVGYQWVRAAVLRIVGAGPERLGPFDDADALRSLGIDLDAVRSTVEATFGPGALEVWSPKTRRRWFRRRPRCEPSAPGLIPLTPRAKKVLELALREALSLRTNWIGTEHLLLGIIREGEGLAAFVLAERLDLDDLRAQVFAHIGKVA